MGDEPSGPLPPGVWMEKFTYANGKTDHIYKRKMSEEGPHAYTDRQGMRHLIYMYGHWVFDWPETARTLSVGFGTINNHTIEHREVGIGLAWNGENLVNFGRDWRKQLIQRVT